MAKLAHVLLGLMLAAIPGAAQTVEYLYSPGTNLERSELAQLETATRSVDVAMYSFTDRELAGELAALAHKGVKVRVYRDREQYQQEGQRDAQNSTAILLAAGVEVRVKGARDLMHLKSYAIDGHLLRTGSANWSPTGLKRQDNDVVYQVAPEAVRQFERKFEEMWLRAGTASPGRPKPIQGRVLPQHAVRPLLRPELALVMLLPLEGLAALRIGTEQLQGTAG